MTRPSSLSAEDPAYRIKLILFDGHGVLTDGGVSIFSASARSHFTADHAKQLECKGGYAISSASMIEAKGRRRFLNRAYCKSFNLWA